METSMCVTVLSSLKSLYWQEVTLRFWNNTSNDVGGNLNNWDRIGTDSSRDRVAGGYDRQQHTPCTNGRNQPCVSPHEPPLPLSFWINKKQNKTVALVKTRDICIAVNTAAATLLDSRRNIHTNYCARCQGGSWAMRWTVAGEKRSTRRTTMTPSVTGHLLVCWPTIGHRLACYRDNYCVGYSV